MAFNFTKKDQDYVFIWEDLLQFFVNDDVVPETRAAGSRAVVVPGRGCATPKFTTPAVGLRRLYS